MINLSDRYSLLIEWHFSKGTNFLYSMGKRFMLKRNFLLGWVGEINNKDHLSPAEAGRWAELGNLGETSYRK